MRNIFKIALTIVLATSASFAVLEIPNAQPKMDAPFWNQVLDKTWDGLKKRNIEPYKNGRGAGLIHRPKSEKPGDAVSEAVGYGMLVALYANDQETFNQILEAGYRDMWSGCYLDWQIFLEGGKSRGAASDAEEDVALSLIFAADLVKAGKWQPYSHAQMGSYEAHAQRILDCMWSTKQITSRGTLAPGAGWGGDDFVNPGYFSPAWYKVFATFDANHNWNMVVDRSYEIIANSPGYAYGMIPDWMTPEGGPTGSLGYNAYFDAKAFYKDAIRILWRVALDALWYDEARAKTFLQNSLKFIKSKGGASASNFFQMDGELLPESDVWTDMKGGTITRKRREHSPLTIGMWMTAAAAVGSDEDRAEFSLEMKKFYDDNADYFGLAVDPSGLEEDTLHNEMYFDQFLAWFGTSLMTGVMNNVSENLNNPKANIESQMTELSKNTEAIAKNLKVPFAIQIKSSKNEINAQASEVLEWALYDLKGVRLAVSSGREFHFKSEKGGTFLIRYKNEKGFSQVKKVHVF